MRTGSLVRRLGGIAFLAVLTLDAPPVLAGDRPELSLQPIGTFRTGIFDASAAEIVAHDPKTQRLFVVNGADAAIDVLDIRNPFRPSRIAQIDVTGLGASPNSVAVHDGVVAVAIEAAVKTDPGTLGLFDAKDGSLLASVTVGALPDMVTFTPDGRWLLVANEGEPSDDYTIDPEGSVSIVALPRDPRRLRQRDVRTADFRRFDSGPLPAGIRIFGPGATVAQDLEPEFIAVSDDSRTAYVTLQENNALAIVDVRTARVTKLVALGTKDHSGAPALRTFPFPELPVLGTTLAGETIALGGFSGLFFEGRGRGGKLRFLTHPDRGPNPEPVDVTGDGVGERPFALPDYQSRFLRFDFDPRTGEIELVDTVLLTRGDGKTPITGLPNLPGPPGLAFADEDPIDLLGRPLARDPFGADLEGIVRAADGTVFMVDEYRPAIYRFDRRGRLLARLVPEGSNAGGVFTGIEALPAVYAQRRANRGFEAVAIEGDTLYAFVQSPLDNPDVRNDASSRASRNVRILALDTRTLRPTAEYVYVIEGGASDKIGDAVALGGGAFLVLERDDAVGPNAQKKIFRIDLAHATNTLRLDPAIVGPGGTLESQDAAGLMAAEITPVRKELAVDLVAVGYDFADKPEGLALIDDGLVAVLNDNDFGLAGGFDLTTGRLERNPAAQRPVLALVSFASNGMDPSDRDGRIRIEPQPVLGMYQPDTIAAYRAFGRTFLVTANEGDARDYAAFAEEARVRDLVLDPVAFPNAEALQQNAALGRLTVTTAHGDDDGDGRFERLFAFGARSFSIRDDEGSLVFDSGEMLERITAAALPAEFNSNNTANDSFDTRSDDKGPEPEGLTLGRIGGRTYLFLGLERIGGIAIFDVSLPSKPRFVTYVNPRRFDGDPEADTAGDLAPEGLTFIPRSESPLRVPLLAVANEVSGSTTLFAILTDD